MAEKLSGGASNPRRQKSKTGRYVAKKKVAHTGRDTISFWQTKGRDGYTQAVRFRSTEKRSSSRIAYGKNINSGSSDAVVFEEEEIISGDAGNDTIFGGSGIDVISEGEDIFVFVGKADIAPGQDVLDLGQLDLSLGEARLQFEEGGDGPVLSVKPSIHPSVEALSYELEELIEEKQGELQEDRINKLAEAIALSEAPTPIMQTIERDNALLRAEVFDNIGAYLSEDIHNIAGAKAGNVAALANRWRGEGKIFGYKRGRSVLYPQFQFKDGQPLPVIKDILTALPESFGDWQRIFWFMAPTGYLSDERPMDCLDQPTRVLKAASKAGSIPAG